MNFIQLLVTFYFSSAIEVVLQAIVTHKMIDYVAMVDKHYAIRSRNSINEEKVIKTALLAVYNTYVCYKMAVSLSNSLGAFIQLIRTNRPLNKLDEWTRNVTIYNSTCQAFTLKRRLNGTYQVRWIGTKNPKMKTIWQDWQVDEVRTGTNRAFSFKVDQ